MAVLSNTPLVRRIHDDSDDMVYFDGHNTPLDPPLVPAYKRYEFVDQADAVPRALLVSIPTQEVPVGTLSVKVPVKGVAYPAGTTLEYSLDGESWSPLETDTQTRIDAEIIASIDGTEGTHTLTVQVRPVDTDNVSEMAFSVNAVV